MYANLSSMPDSVVGTLGNIAAGFSDSDLSLLTVNSYETITQLGKVNVWTSSQVNILKYSR